MKLVSQLYSVKEVGVSDITGTRQQFWPDDTIFHRNGV